MGYLDIPGWEVILSGDIASPHESYRALENERTNFIYLSPEDQDRHYPELSKSLGWNVIQRRVIAIVHAHRAGHEVIATVDDDNVPLPLWGADVRIGQPTEVDFFESAATVFDPLSVTNHPDYWHRGFPVQELETRKNPRLVGTRQVIPLVQAELWNGDPDVDAICRIALHPEVEYQQRARPWSSDQVFPFNSQNTFLHRDAVPYYFLFPGIGRMDDIWAAYLMCHWFPGQIVFGNASVLHKRNQHDLVGDLDQEMLGYKHSLDVANSPAAMASVLPRVSLKALAEYRKLFSDTELELLSDRKNLV